MINWSDLLTNMAHNATLIAYICHLSVIYGFTMFYRHEKYVSQTPLCHLSVANKRFVLRGFVFRIDIIDGIRINFYRGHQSVTPCNTTYHPASSSKAPALLSPGTPPVRKQWWLHQCQFSFSKRAMLQTQKQLVTSCDELHHVTLASSSSGKLWKSCVVSSMCCFFQSGSPWPWAVVFRFGDLRNAKKMSKMLNESVNISLKCSNYDFNLELCALQSQVEYVGKIFESTLFQSYFNLSSDSNDSNNSKSCPKTIPTVNIM